MELVILAIDLKIKKNNFNDLIESFEKSKRLGLNLALNIQFNGDLYLFLVRQFFEKNYHLGF